MAQYTTPQCHYNAQLHSGVVDPKVGSGKSDDMVSSHWWPSSILCEAHPGDSFSDLTLHAKIATIKILSKNAANSREREAQRVASCMNGTRPTGILRGHNYESTNHEMLPGHVRKIDKARGSGGLPPEKFY